MNGDIAHSEPEPPSLPRKITIERGDQGYGFNLHGEKGIHGQYISAIDEGSPAEKNDLRVGDRVIGVNGEDVENLAHSKVVERIRAGGSQVTLLVVDEQCDQYYKDIDVKVPQDRYVIPNVAQAVPEANHISDDEPRNAIKTPDNRGGDSVDANAESGADETQDILEEATKESEITKDDDGYDVVIPKKKPETKPVEIQPAYHAPAQEPTDLTGTTTSTTTTTSNEQEAIDDHSSKLDMAAARPKPKRHEVKRATQNWKQKYDDFNKL